MQDTQGRSSSRFPLSDLLSVPMQRILKYPLLLKVRGGAVLGGEGRGCVSGGEGRGCVSGGEGRGCVRGGAV